MPNLWNKKNLVQDILGDAWLQILMIQIAQKMRQAEGEGEQEVTIGLVGKTLEYINENLTKDSGNHKCSLPFTNSTTSARAPNRLVSMLMGISIVIRVRASVSHRSRKIAPLTAVIPISL